MVAPLSTPRPPPPRPADADAPPSGSCSRSSAAPSRGARSTPPCASRAPTAPRSSPSSSPRADAPAARHAAAAPVQQGMPLLETIEQRAIGARRARRLAHRARPHRSPRPARGDRATSATTGSWSPPRAARSEGFHGERHRVAARPRPRRGRDHPPRRRRPAQRRTTRAASCAGDQARPRRELAGAAGRIPASASDSADARRRRHRPARRSPRPSPPSGRAPIDTWRARQGRGAHPRRPRGRVRGHRTVWRISLKDLRRPLSVGRSGRRGPIGHTDGTGARLVL